MQLFDDNDLHRKEVEIQGKKFTLVEPSALALTRHYDRISEKSKEAAAIDDNGSFRKQVLYTEINFDLVATCLRDQFPDVAHIELYESLCEQVTNFQDIISLTNAAEEICNLKFQGSDSQEESSQDD